MALEGLCGTKRHGVPVPTGLPRRFCISGCRRKAVQQQFLDTFIGENVKKRPPVLNSLHISEGQKNKKLAEKTKM